MEVYLSFLPRKKNKSTYVDLLTQTHNSLEISQIGLIIATTHWVKNVSIVSYFKCFASLEPYNDFCKIPDFSPNFFFDFCTFLFSEDKNPDGEKL